MTKTETKAKTKSGTTVEIPTELMTPLSVSLGHIRKVRPDLTEEEARAIRRVEVLALLKVAGFGLGWLLYGAIRVAWFLLKVALAGLVLFLMFAISVACTIMGGK